MTTAIAAAPAASPLPAHVREDVDTLVRRHLSLVGHIVRETMSRLPSHVCRDDLVSAGMYALVLSARGYDAARGVPFARFAAIRIRGAITDELRSLDWASRSVRGRARSIDTARSELAVSLGRSATREEVAQNLGIAVGEVESADADVQRAAVMSLHGFDTDDGMPVVASDDSPESSLLSRERIGYLHDAIAELPERLRTVVEEYFFEQRRMTDIAADLGVTESRVSQMRGEALAMLRAAVRTAEEPHIAPATPMRRQAARYCAAVAARSTLAGRLSRTTVHGEPLALRMVG